MLLNKETLFGARGTDKQGPARRLGYLPGTKAGKAKGCRTSGIRKEGGRRKLAGTGRCQRLGSGKGHGGADYVVWLSRGHGGTRTAGPKILCACAVPGAGWVPWAGGVWLWGRRGCRAVLPFLCTLAAEACAFGASLFSSGGEVSALPYSRNLCGPARWSPAFAPARPEPLALHVSPGPLRSPAANSDLWST